MVNNILIDGEEEAGGGDGVPGAARDQETRRERERVQYCEVRRSKEPGDGEITIRTELRAESWPRTCSPLHINRLSSLFFSKWVKTILFLFL